MFNMLANRRDSIETEIARLMNLHESGQITRRRFVAQLSAVATAMVGTTGAASAQEKRGESTFRANSLNHVALHVKDIERSIDFYRKHLGLEIAKHSVPSRCFLSFGNDILGLFQKDERRIVHFCFNVDGYEVGDAVKKLGEQGLNPQHVPGGHNVYFKDPDGITIQLASQDLIDRVRDGSGTRAPDESTFKANGLNHVALNVRDINRSRDFYVKHLGITVAQNDPMSSSCFLTFGNDFLGLFQSDNEPKINHFCFAVDDYDFNDAVKKLEKQGFKQFYGSNTYFKDPDGNHVQISSKTHGPKAKGETR